MSPHFIVTSGQSGVSFGLIIAELGDVEIGNFDDLAVARNQDIIGFEITMTHSVFMKIIDA